MILYVIKQEFNHIVCSYYQEALSKYALGNFRYPLWFFVLKCQFCFFPYILVMSVLKCDGYC